MKSLALIMFVAVGLAVGCASEQQVDSQNETVREHQTAEDRAAQQQEMQIRRQLRETGEQPF